MLKTLLARARQGRRTIAFPAGEPTLPDRFRGRPALVSGACPPGCHACADVCPTGAVGADGGPRLDLGRCLFCGGCADACPERRITFTNGFRLATRARSHLVLAGEELRLATALEATIRRLLGRSLRLRQVSAGGCNACEADANVLSTVVFDLSRFGIGFVASPRHADGLLVTGPVSENMRAALLATYEAMPSPRIVIASGACAISGGPFAGHPEVHGGVAELLPVDLFVPGCPPHPLTLLDGILRLLGRAGRG